MMRAVRMVFLVGIWLALWSDLSLANAVSGLALASAVVLIFDTWPDGAFAFRPLRALHFGLFFLLKLVQSTLVVARTVIQPHHRIHTGIVAVPLRGCSDAVATLIADAISLTPGTLTLEVRREPLTLFVHALDVSDVESVEADVRALEVLAVRAFGDQDAIEGLDLDDITTWRAR